VLQSIGGMISFNADKSFKSTRVTKADNAKQLFKAIAEQLK